jgi:hypothetical protein
VSPGQHAAPDGAFNRPATNALARGVVLIVVGVIVAVLLLRSTDSAEPFRSTTGTTTASGGGGQTTNTTAAQGGATTTTAPAKAHDPATVTVLVANGSGVKGAAAKIATTLKGSNYITATPGNTAAVNASVVYFAPGYELDAKAVAALLKPTPGTAALPNPPPVTDLAGSQVLVVIAADLAK